MSTVLRGLQEWYTSQCNGEWEHGYSVCIDTLDNPGWKVRVNLCGTELASVTFEDISIRRSDDDWLDCRVRQQQFEAFGGPQNLEEMLSVFLAWTKQQ